MLRIIPHLIKYLFPERNHSSRKRSNLYEILILLPNRQIFSGFNSSRHHHTNVRLSVKDLNHTCQRPIAKTTIIIQHKNILAATVCKKVIASAGATEIPWQAYQIDGGILRRDGIGRAI